MNSFADLLEERQRQYDQQQSQQQYQQNLRFWESLTSGIGRGLTAGQVVPVRSIDDVEFLGYALTDSSEDELVQVRVGSMPRAAEAARENLAALIFDSKPFMKVKEVFSKIKNKLCMCSEMLWEDTKTEETQINIEEGMTLCSETLWS